jgi:hypothetical protein
VNAYIGKSSDDDKNRNGDNEISTEGAGFLQRVPCKQTWPLDERINFALQSLLLLTRKILDGMSRSTSRA